MEQRIEVIWKPIPSSSQAFALDTRAQHTLFHGTRGPGKTITQLMRFRRRVGLGYGSYWRGILLDREYKNLADIIAQGNRFFTKFDDGCKFLSSNNDLKWTWPTGEELLLRHAKKRGDYDNFHGHEYPFIGWNELTKQPTADLYDAMMSTNRSSFLPKIHTPIDSETGKYATKDGNPLPSIPLEVFSTTNPKGPGHNWVKKRFIDPAPSGTVVRRLVKIYNPQTKCDEDFEITQVAIFGSYKENPYLDPKYVATLNDLTSSNENLKRAWLYGDWSVISGGAFDDLWDNQIHVKPRFKVPAHWNIDRSFDWGSTHPFSVNWWAEATGEEVKLVNGDTFCPQRGSLIQIAEWYGTEEIGTNRGLKLSADDIALEIDKRENIMIEKGWIARKPLPGPADNQIRDVREKDVDTIEIKMAKRGIRWTESDKSAGSRVIGFQLTRDRLEAAVRGEGPALYFTSNNKAALEILPNLPRDEDKPDDIDTDAEEHIYDAVRYRVLKGSNRYAKNLSLQFAR